MKFYDCKTAPSPRRVRIFLAEKGIELDTVEVNLAEGEQHSDEFATINPDRVVPVLELDDGSYLSEVVAICQYLEELHPEPALLGSTPEERARVSMWNAKVEQQGLFVSLRTIHRQPGIGVLAVVPCEPDFFGLGLRAHLGQVGQCAQSL